MADNKFFTNTYITGKGRRNYLTIKELEDPLFTSFTFDIDFLTSPLFYTIYDYGADALNTISLSNRIENALKEMRNNNMNVDQGYDILPVMSKSGNFGFGIQQNVYMDKPLYGATEYIYMVDKRNGTADQNDVKGGTSDGISYTNDDNLNRSIQLGNSVNTLANDRDKSWAEREKQQHEKHMSECDKIMNDEYVKNTHEENERNVDVTRDECIAIKGVVDGKEYTESELQNEVNRLKGLNDSFENLKKEIVDYVNNELLTYQNKGTVIYEKNKCVQKIFSYDDIGFGENKNLYIQKIKGEFGKDFKNKYLINGDESYVVKFKNLYKDFKKQFNDNRYIIDVEFKTKFFSKLVKFGISNPVISISGIKSLPDWATKLCTHLTYFVENPDNYKDNDNHIQYMMSCQCDINTSFDKTFSSSIVKNNEELLMKFETELENIRVALYGMENGEICDKNNPSPDSAYGKYLEAKEKLENDEYSQAEKAYGMASSGASDMQTMLDEYVENGINDIPQTSTGNDSSLIDSSSTNVVAPQTVFDILGFINGMKKMITEYPYIIQGITGLDTAYNKHYGIKDPYLGSGEDKITITCLESIDLRVSSMFNRYFNAVYDRQYRRERVPINLRRFNCSVYVHDVRNFNPKRDDGITRISELRDMYFSAIEFRFYDCEIVPEETGNIFNDVSNEAPSEMKKTNFTFTYGNCVVNFLPVK
jgi:hypothetical protein